MQPEHMWKFFNGTSAVPFKRSDGLQDVWVDVAPTSAAPAKKSKGLWGRSMSSSSSGGSSQQEQVTCGPFTTAAAPAGSEGSAGSTGPGAVHDSGTNVRQYKLLYGPLAHQACIPLLGEKSIPESELLQWLMLQCAAECVAVRDGVHKVTQRKGPGVRSKGWTFEDGQWKRRNPEGTWHWNVDTGKWVWVEKETGYKGKGTASGGIISGEGGSASSGGSNSQGSADGEEGDEGAHRLPPSLAELCSQPGGVTGPQAAKQLLRVMSQHSVLLPPLHKGQWRLPPEQFKKQVAEDQAAAAAAAAAKDAAAEAGAGEGEAKPKWMTQEAEPPPPSVDELPDLLVELTPDVSGLLTV